VCQRAVTDAGARSRRYACWMMKLHNYFRSSASYRVRIALNLKGLDYEYLPVQIARGEHQAGPYAAISADQLVPLLEDDGERFSQSMAIIEYLDEIHPEPALLPHDPVGRARVRALSESIACEIHPVNNLRVLKYLVQELKLDEAAKNRWYRHWVREGLKAFERQLAQHPAGIYCWGNTPTMADCCLVPQIFNAQRFECDLSDLPRTMAVHDACMDTDAFQRAQPSHCPDADS
jgi:maleylpyruvate isomerase